MERNVSDQIAKAREAFLNLIADAKVWEEDVDGDADEYGRLIVYVSYRIETDQMQLEELAEALGITTKWGESIKDAIDRAVSAPAS